MWFVHFFLVLFQQLFRNLRRDLKHVWRILDRWYEKIVFLTVPPIPVRGEAINQQIRRINNFLLGWQQSEYSSQMS